MTDELRPRIRLGGARCEMCVRQRRKRGKPVGVLIP
jgi:hypothetical protein